jgi:hypothetical protein
MSADLFYIRGKFLQLKRKRDEQVAVWKERVRFVISALYSGLELEEATFLSNFHAKKVAFGCSYSKDIEKQLENALKSIKKSNP